MRTDGVFAQVSDLVLDKNLHTVCQSARCPNKHDCWNRSTATFMILGNRCTRRCAFCAVSTGKPVSPDSTEPEKVADAAAHMKLRHVVVTSVTRDDLADGGAGFFAETITAVKSRISSATVEVLTPDFHGLEQPVRTVLDAHPEVFGHNLETVRRLQAEIRPQAGYERSLSVLKMAAALQDFAVVKSGLMLGLGESRDEVLEALSDLFHAGCRLLTLGQYLAPTRKHRSVDRYVDPGEFAEYESAARKMGFLGVAAVPLARSSYRARELLELSR